jgi:glycosyltransferase involved in cell wall biosynthesis
MEKISVLMPVKNGAQFLLTSIRNIESNVAPDDEILIVNDGSIDETPQILKSWARRNPNVRLLESGGTGLVSALNLGISEAGNKWIARFDVDDEYSDSRIAQQRKLITPLTSAIFCDYRFHNPRGKSLGVIPSAVGADATAISLISSQRTPHPGVIFNREFVLEAGGYRKEDFPAEDISLWLRLAKVGQIVSVPEVLLEYRLSKNSVSAENRTIALSKTNHLIRQIGINQKHVNACLQTWMAQFQDYSGMSFPSERKLLFYRDLHRSTALFESNEFLQREIRQIVFALIKSPQSINGVRNLVVGRAQRKLFRSS